LRDFEVVSSALSSLLTPSFFPSTRKDQSRRINDRLARRIVGIENPPASLLYIFLQIGIRRGLENPRAPLFFREHRYFCLLGSTPCSARAPVFCIRRTLSLLTMIVSPSVLCERWYGKQIVELLTVHMKHLIFFSVLFLRRSYAANESLSNFR